MHMVDWFPTLAEAAGVTHDGKNTHTNLRKFRSRMIIDLNAVTLTKYQSGIQWELE